MSEDAGSVVTAVERLYAGEPADAPGGAGGERFFLDDLTVGQRFVSATREISKARIMSFASEFDPQPFHLNEDLAQASFFKGLAASGWHTAALTMRLLVDGGLPLAGGLIGAGLEMEWPRPTRPGDMLHVESEIVAISPSKSRPDRGIVTARGETRNHRNEVVQIMTVKLVVMRKS
ncbi:MaoC family dehydratase [Mesorhizobium sp. VK23B]|uniref:MaoC family dehydratase n=1 Tax=Mesorhizobium dulcispinae TaxID=3072316 RepID=A0ABU4XPK5_9HYPH|nr:MULTISPECIES: MaoC family dehydratase [unclassified Mesorhizobium]MDX8470277.1 MaoC family dehydratase [Mesorhizobium sp. VK23B]MDX8476668.1 MaoC family dehydratase [Mesorhizobium sp. VK23A]